MKLLPLLLLCIVGCMTGCGSVINPKAGEVWVYTDEADYNGTHIGTGWELDSIVGGPKGPFTVYQIINRSGRPFLILRTAYFKLGRHSIDYAAYKKEQDSLMSANKNN